MGIVDTTTRSLAGLINSPFEFLYRLLERLLSLIVRAVLDCKPDVELD